MLSSLNRKKGSTTPPHRPESLRLTRDPAQPSPAAAGVGGQSCHPGGKLDGGCIPWPTRETSRKH